MPAAGYWMYFYDKKSPTTLRNAYYKNQEGNVVPAPNSLQLDENGGLPHKLYYFVDVSSVDKILEKPYKSSNKIEKINKNFRCFVKSGKNTPKIFNFTEKTLNQMTFFINMLIVISLHFSISF